MINWIKNLYFPSQVLEQADFELMCKDGKVIEKDERGIKVIQLVNGDMLKVFRLRSLLSGAHIYSYARRFCRNAERLHALNIATVHVKALYLIKNSNYSAVLYKPLAGKTIKQLIASNEVSTTLAQSLGSFIARLHQEGVHFHSLHTGNIVLSPEGTLGLIDISDMSIFPWPLFCNTRVRSFKRLCRYPEDIKSLGEDFWERLLAQYFKDGHTGRSCCTKIEHIYRELNSNA